MPTVIMPTRPVGFMPEAGEPVARYAVLRLTPAACESLCRLIGLANDVAARTGRGFYGLTLAAADGEVEFCNNMRVDAVDYTAIRDAETGERIFAGDGPDVALADGDDTFVLPDGPAVSTDAGKLSLATEAIVVTRTGVSWCAQHRHSNEECDTAEIDHWQLAAWAGRLTLPRPWRQIHWRDREGIMRDAPVPAVWS